MRIEDRIPVGAPSGPPTGAGQERSARRWRVIHAVLAIVTLLSFAPLICVMLASATASWFGCRLDEGDPHPCVILGADRGETLYALAVMGWLMLVTWPGMVLTPLCWLGLLIRAVIRRVRPRSAPPSRSSP